MTKSHRRFNKYKNCFDVILSLCDGVEKHYAGDKSYGDGLDSCRLIRYEVEKVYKPVKVKT